MRLVLGLLLAGFSVASVLANTLPTPIISPAGGTFSGSRTVSIGNGSAQLPTISWLGRVGNGSSQSSMTVAPGTVVTLELNAQNAVECVGAAGRVIPSTGQWQLTLYKPVYLKVTCHGLAGERSAIVDVRVSGVAAAPQVNISANQNSMSSPGAVYVSWSSQGASHCYDENQQPVSTSGQAWKNISNTTTFNIDCYTEQNLGGARANAQVTTIVQPTIYYTINGASPSASSIRYTTPFTLYDSHTVRAIAIKQGFSDSAVATAIFNKRASVSLPRIEPNGGIFTNSALVSIINTHTNDAPQPTMQWGVQLGNGSVSRNVELDHGTPFALKLLAQNATDCVGSAGRIISTTEEWTLVATSSSRISVTCRGAGGVVSGVAEVMVKGLVKPPQVSISASTPYLSSSGQVTVSWSATDAQVCYDENQQPVATSGTSVRHISHTTTFTRNCYGRDSVGIDTGEQRSVAQVNTIVGGTPTQIFYTTDGTTPTPSATLLYSGPFTLSKSATVRAFATKQGFDDSALVSATFSRQVSVSAPSIIPNGGTFENAAIVTLQNTHPGDVPQPTMQFGAQVGNAPLKGKILVSPGTQYTLKLAAQNATECFGGAGRQISTTGEWVLWATSSARVSITCRSPGGVVTGVVEVVVIGSSNVPNVDVSVSTHHLSSGGSVTVSWAAPDAQICYDENQQPIATSGTVINNVSSTTTFTRNCYGSDSTEVDVGERRSVAQVTTIVGGTATQIFYTTDGSTPSRSSNAYQGSFELDKSATIKAIAVKPGYSDSNVSQAEFTIYGKVVAPIIAPLERHFVDSVDVSIQTTTSGVNIFYTLDGSSPEISSTRISGSRFRLSNTTLVKAIAIKQGFANSDTISAEFIKNAHPGWENIGLCDPRTNTQLQICIDGARCKMDETRVIDGVCSQAVTCEN